MPVNNAAWRRRWPGAAMAAIVAIAGLGWPRLLTRVRTFNEARDLRSRIVDRLDADARFVRAELETATMTATERAALRARLTAAANDVATIPRPDPARFNTVLPLNATHAGILAVHGAMIAASGLPLLSSGIVSSYRNSCSQRLPRGPTTCGSSL